MKCNVGFVKLGERAMQSIDDGGDLSMPGECKVIYDDNGAALIRLEDLLTTFLSEWRQDDINRSAAYLSLICRLSA